MTFALNNDDASPTQDLTLGFFDTEEPTAELVVAPKMTLPKQGVLNMEKPIESPVVVLRTPSPSPVYEVTPNPTNQAIVEPKKPSLTEEPKLGEEPTEFPVVALSSSSPTEDLTLDEKEAAAFLSSDTPTNTGTFFTHTHIPAYKEEKPIPTGNGSIVDLFVP